MPYCDERESLGQLKGLTASQLPVVVDLDHTLVMTDTLHEQAVAAIFTRPAGFLRAVVQLYKGRASLKSALVHEVDVSEIVLPIREDLVKWLHDQANLGRKIHLCSAASQSVVDVVAARLGIFETAIGSGDVNLKGKAKAEHLVKTFPDGFVYVGDHRADLLVWEKSSGIVLAGVSSAVGSAARSLNKPIEAVFTNSPLGVKGLIKALRVHHWSKNVLMFLPLILGHKWFDGPLLVNTLLGFLCLLMVTSSTYLINDMADLSADRQHWSKRNRALASGRLPIKTGIVLAAVFLCTGLVTAFLLSPMFLLALLAYLALTLAYSFGLKRIPLLDVLVIGVLFTTRLIMGIAFIPEPNPAWLLTFSLFFFFSLAVAKRHTELVRAAISGTHSLKSRGYLVEDAPLTLTLGIASAIAALLVLVLFIVEEMLPGEMYAHPQMLGGMPIVLSIWIGRIWLLAHRGQMNDDPVSFALRDRASIGLGLLVTVIFMLAL